MDKKLCITCRRKKERSEFYKCKRWSDGLDYSCKKCRGRLNAASRKKLRRDPERLALFRKKENARQKAKYAADPEFRAKVAAYKRLHYAANKEQYLCNVSKRKARKLGSGGSHSDEAWRQMLALFGGKCLCCGKAERITKDHIIPVARGGTDDITNIQPLCIWCNKSKFTCGRDFRTKEKVVLRRLNAVGRLIFGNGKVTAEEKRAIEKYKPLSRFVGVSYAPKNERSVNVWRARIQIDNRMISLGRFATEQEAAKAYNEAARKLIGPNAYVNELSEKRAQSFGG